VSENIYLRYLPITGYLDNVSGRAGDSFDVKVSAQGLDDYKADIVRIICADPNPAGPGLRYEAQKFDLAGCYPPRSQPIDLGSYGEVPANSCFVAPKMLIGLLIQPGILRSSPSVLAASQNPIGDGWVLELNKQEIKFSYKSTNGSVESISLRTSIKCSSWYHIWAGYDVLEGRLLLGCQSKFDGALSIQERNVELNRVGDCSKLTFAAKKTDNQSADHFNGRIEDPVLYAKLPVRECPPTLPDEAGDGEIVAWWDFSIGIETQTLVDRGSRGLGGRLVNIPYRGMRGINWTGRFMHWRDSPREYAAIHFHEDDLHDCGWDTDFSFKIPYSAKSGVYGLRLRQGSSEDILPFYILPANDKKKNKICYLASTFTYQAYANHARGNCDQQMRSRMRDWGANPHNPDDYPVYGKSTYNFHPDGTGTSISSRLRPVLTHRSGYLTFMDNAGSGLRHFSADSHLLNWFEDSYIDFDVITDEDLDNEGLSLISSYSTIITGSHPEYHTARMLDCLQSYRDQGGKFIYLGGNGFYWKITRIPSLPGVIELRRAEGGIRAWATAPGESYHQLDGEYGGLWRRNGRPPQKLAGVGFSAQGLFEGSYYRRMPDSYKLEADWVFEGVTEEKLGDYGLSGGGAAGFELDRADFALGTPEGTFILARSENHSDSFVTVPEELLSHINTVTGEDPADLIRAEIVYGKLPNGGEIFSVGSICFCGSLNYNNGNNGVSKMLRNVVRRFAGV